MKFVVVISKKDKAGMNILDKLKGSDFKKIFLIEEESIYASPQQLNNLDADFIVFATKHQSEQHRKTLSVHAPGNWHKAEFGGEPRKLCKTSAIVIKKLFLELTKQAITKPEYQVTLEVTHHGPFLEKPCCFIEIGSTKEEWQDEEAGKIIARTIVEFTKIKLEKTIPVIPTILLGGGHYSQAANKITLRTDYAFGHICPKYMLEHLDEKMLAQAINKTAPKPELVLLDWKGLGKYKQKIVTLLEKIGLKYEKVQKVLH